MKTNKRFSVLSALCFQFISQSFYLPLPTLSLSFSLSFFSLILSTFLYIPFSFSSRWRLHALYAFNKRNQTWTIPHSECLLALLQLYLFQFMCCLYWLCHIFGFFYIYFLTCSHSIWPQSRVYYRLLARISFDSNPFDNTDLSWTSMVMKNASPFGLGRGCPEKKKYSPQHEAATWFIEMTR